jgi:hypothetical protein
MIRTFIQEVQVLLDRSPLVLSVHIDKYYGSPKEAYIRGKALFLDASSLEIAVYVLQIGRRLSFEKYRYHYMDTKGQTVFRYDNAPHHRNIKTFPDHKHVSDSGVQASKRPPLEELLEEISAHLLK